MRTFLPSLLCCWFVWAGCVDRDIVHCSDGTFCGAASVCAITTIGTFCVSPDTASACTGKSDGDACTLGADPATCHGGACFTDVCLDGLVGASEVCDDGNAIPDDSCSLDCRSTNVCGNKIVDVALGEERDTGDPQEHDGCSSGCRVETQHWRLLDIEHPRGLTDTQLVYDAKRRRSVLFGGRRGGGLVRETWEWDGQQWKQFQPQIDPGPRYGHRMAYDAAREQVVLFSGVSTAADTWTWDGGTWTLQHPAASPPARYDSTLVYDAHAQRVVLFGGRDANNYFNDTWTWDGKTWTQLTTADAPSGRSSAFASYDPKRGVIVLFGGMSPTVLGDTWELDGMTWTLKATTGPSARYGTAMTFDPLSGKMLLVDGNTAASTVHDAFAWDGSAWGSVSDVPSSAAGAVMATDSVRGHAILFDVTGNLYELASAGWSQSSTGSYASTAPADRQGAVAVADPDRHRLVVFGGASDTMNGTEIAETWSWNGEWTKIGDAASPPSARNGAAAAYDPVRKQVVLFGGCGNATDPAFGDMYVLDGTTWSARTGGLPPARCFATMVFDRKAGKIVMHGGQNGTTTLADTWTWDGTSWHHELPATPGPTVSAATAAYDEVDQRMILFGGTTYVDDEGLNDPKNETWSWDGASWAKLATLSTPSGRAGAGMAWDAARARLVMFGGYAPDLLGAGDVWEWEHTPGGGDWRLRTASEIGVLQFFAMTSALDGAGVLVFGGRMLDKFAYINGDVILNHDVWRLRWDGSSPEERCSGTDTDHDGKVDCDDPDCIASCATCGNGTCDPDEHCLSCAADCGACVSTCGDFVCTAGETCVGDCP